MEFFLLLVDRFNNGMRLSEIKLFYSSPQCYSSESEVGVKFDIPSLFSSLEDDFFSELGSVEKKGDLIEIINLLTKNPEPEISQETNGKKKKKKKKKKVEETSDSISKLKLFTEKPEHSWKTNGKRKKEEHASSLPVTDLNVFSLFKPEKSSLSSIRDLDANAQNVIQAIASLPSRNVTDSNVSSFSETEKSSSLVQDHESEAQNIISSSFEVKKADEADLILEEVNDATVDCSQWTAKIVSNAEEEEACEDQIGMRITRSYEDLDEQITMRRILVKDLDVLMHSVMHLEKLKSQ